MPIDTAQLLTNSIDDGYSVASADADRYVTVPLTDGQIDFASINDEVSSASGLQPLPIRLANGRHRQNGGYGIAHIFASHARGLARFDFHSVQDFVDHVAIGFDAVYTGRRGRSLIVARQDQSLPMHRLLVLQPRGGCYGVVTGWVTGSERKINGILIAERVVRGGVPVWERRAPRSSEPG